MGRILEMGTNLYVDKYVWRRICMGRICRRRIVWGRIIWFPCRAQKIQLHPRSVLCKKSYVLQSVRGGLWAYSIQQIFLQLNFYLSAQPDMRSRLIYKEVRLRTEANMERFEASMTNTKFKDFLRVLQFRF